MTTRKLTRVLFTTSMNEVVDVDQNEETFGIRMQKSRESKGWTIEKLANTLSVTENIVADYEWQIGLRTYWMCRCIICYLVRSIV